MDSVLSTRRVAGAALGSAILLAAAGSSSAGTAPVPRLNQPRGETRTLLRYTPRTLVSTRQQVTGFAQDGGWLTWMTVSTSRGCKSQLRILALRTRRSVSVPRTGGCQVAWGLVLDGDRALWMADGGYSNLSAWNSFRSASVRDPRARVIDGACFNREAGEFPQPASVGGAGSLLFYTESCEESLTHPPTVKRVVAGKVVSFFTPSGSGRTIGLATSKDRIALIKYVFDPYAEAVSDLTWVELRSREGALLREFSSPGAPGAVALGPDYVALLTASRGKRPVIRLFDAETGASRAVVPAPAGTVGRLAASGRWVAFQTGRTIRLLDTTTRALSVAVRAASPPIGLSTSGRRLAWAEASPRGSRIRAVTLRP